MNYWKQFAEMLGLELGEKFELTYDDGTINEDTYKIEEDGFYYKNKQSEDWFAEPSTTINKLISGYCKAVPKTFKPKYGEQYWSYSLRNNQARCSLFGDYVEDYAMWKSGNCFRTEENLKPKAKKLWRNL